MLQQGKRNCLVVLLILGKPSIRFGIGVFFIKLLTSVFVGKSLDLIKNIYKNTRCAVRVADHTTDFVDYTKGVTQGCPLSPILINIYVKDIFEIMNSNNSSEITLDEDNNINGLMYADDLTLLSETKDGLMYADDLTLLSETKDGLMYADDLTLLSETKDGLQKQIDKLLIFVQSGN